MGRVVAGDSRRCKTVAHWGFVDGMTRAKMMGMVPALPVVACIDRKKPFDGLCAPGHAEA